MRGDDDRDKFGDSMRARAEALESLGLLDGPLPAPRVYPTRQEALATLAAWCDANPKATLDELLGAAVRCECSVASTEDKEQLRKVLRKPLGNVPRCTAAELARTARRSAARMKGKR